MKKKLVLLGSLLAVAVLAVAAVGGVVRAQTPSPSPSGPSGSAQAPQAGQGAGARAGIDSFLNALAQNLGITRSALNSGLQTTATQQIDQAVAAGKITQQQASQADQRIANGQLPFGILGGGRRHGGGGPGRGNGQGQPGSSAGRGGGQGQPGNSALASCFTAAQQALTSTLGISASDLSQARQSGQTLDQIAQAQGTSLQALQDAISTAATSCLDQQVQSGTITAAQEQSILQRLQNGLTSPRPGRPGTGSQPPSSGGAS